MSDPISPDQPTHASNASPGQGQEATDVAGTAAPVNAEIGARVLAFLIDCVVALVLMIVPLVGGLISAAYWLVRDGLDLEFMDHRSIGKKIMKIRPLTLDGTPLGPTGSMRRNWMFALGAFGGFLGQIQILGWVGASMVSGIGGLVILIEVYLVFTDPDGRRIGDNMADTRVVES